MSSDPTQLSGNPSTEPQDDPLSDWESRKRLAHLLYDKGSYQEAADLIWEVPEIPSIDIELAFAARILAKGSPRKAIRLLTALLEHNRGKAVQNLALANALLNHGMVIQAARFYGAALEADPTIGNPDLEHFILWIDDEEKLWGDFRRVRPQLGELPWMRDPKMAMKLTNRIKLHTTPLSMPSLPAVPGEELRNEMYLQEPLKNMLPTPPPAVTIPMDRVESKYRRYDAVMGAANDPGSADESAAEATAAPAMAATPATPTPFVAVGPRPGLRTTPMPLVPDGQLPTPAVPATPTPAAVVVKPPLYAPSTVTTTVPLTPAAAVPTKPTLPALPPFPAFPAKPRPLMPTRQTP